MVDVSSNSLQFDVKQAVQTNTAASQNSFKAAQITAQAQPSDDGARLRLPPLVLPRVSPSSEERQIQQSQQQLNMKMQERALMKNAVDQFAGQQNNQSTGANEQESARRQQSQRL